MKKKKRDEKAFLDFCEKRLQTDEAGIYEPIKNEAQDLQRHCNYN